MTNENKKKRYYWFKLKLSFLDSPKVDFLMSQRGGANYVVIYQMLCLKAINNNGKLQTNVNECLIRWDDNKIQRECKYFDIDTIRIAMTLFLKLGLIIPDENGILQIQDYEELVGSETNAAIEQRKYRNSKDRQKIDNKIDNVYLENSNIKDIEPSQKIDKRIDNVYQENRDKSIDSRDNILENKDKTKIKQDKTREKELSFPEKLAFELFDCGYENSDDYNLERYSNQISEWLDNHDHLDVKVKIEYFIKQISHYLPNGKYDKNGKELFSYVYDKKNNDMIANKFLYFKSAIERGFERISETTA